MPRIARLGRDVIVIFGATDYVAPVKFRLFHAEGNRFTGVAYRIAPNPDGGETWTPDAFNEVDLLEVLESIPSLRVISPGLPTTLEVGDADLTRLTLKAQQPQRGTAPWLRHR
jgi:hypothetical protein